MSIFFGLLSGLTFGLGLILAGMTDPQKVKAFLDLAGPWDPSLALVMGGAIAVGVFAFARARPRGRCWTGGLMEIPQERSVRLFGVGWGLGGFCPGPAIVALGGGMPEAGVFVAAMLAGMVLHEIVLARR
jgi:uncharacterized protein